MHQPRHTAPEHGGESGSDSDDDDDSVNDDPCVNRSLCFCLLLLAVLGALTATRTTIFDKILGHPLSSNEAIVVIAVVIVSSCLCCVCVQRRMHRAAAQAKLERTSAAVASTASAAHEIGLRDTATSEPAALSVAQRQQVTEL